MSSFISSFIVDPVIRQARRFSRSSTPSDFAPTEDPSCDGDRISNLVGARNMAAQEEVRLRLDISSEYGGPSSNIISDHPVVLSPTSEDDGLEDDLRSSHQHNQLITDHSDNNSNPEQSTLQLGRQRSGPRMEENTYNGPLQRIVERSNTSHSNSIYSTTDSDMTPVEDSVLLRRHTSQEGSRGGSGTYNGKMGSGPLPADDGMGVVRKRIIEIQRSGVSTKEKSRLIHDLMTREYNSSQANLRSLERPFTPENSHQPEEWTHVSPSTSLSSNSAETVDFWYVSPEDLKPSYYTPPSHPKASQDVNAMDQDECLQDEAKTLGCTHYMRNVKLQCSVCFRWYTCRFCHDAAEDHPLNRRETKNMLCMLCGCAQRAAGECRACGESAAWYYCGVCKLWDNDPEKNIYHCDDCGICRIGQGLGKDFYHCKTCMVCLQISIRDTHRCIERSTDCDCPICGEYMFTSPQAVVFMRCGHSIHHLCYYEHMKNSYKCPICSRSIINMEIQFRRLDQAIEYQPMPPQFEDTKALVYCNDCCAKTSVKYHWLGLKCAVCDSYNTAQIQILSGTDTDAATLEANRPTNSDSVDLLLPEALRAVPNDRQQATTTPSVRPISSTSALSSLHSSSQRTPSLRMFRSASPILSHHEQASTSIPIPTTVATHDPMEMHDDNDSQSDSELDDVDFWGGQSPRERARIARRQEDMEMESEGDEDGDELTDDELEEEEEEEEGEVDYMDIFGHR